MREYTYHVDLDGQLWHEGCLLEEVPEVYAALYRSIARSEDGRLYGLCQGERCWLVPEDSLFVVRSIDVHYSERAPAVRGEVDSIVLTLVGDIQVPLDPSEVYVGQENVLYVRLKDGAFDARFSRPAYYDLAQYVLPCKGGFALRLKGKEFLIENSSGLSG